MKVAFLIIQIFTIQYLTSTFFVSFQAGGSVGANGRLQGRLEVSRAFGDRQFKKVSTHYLILLDDIKFALVSTCRGYKQLPSLPSKMEYA